MQWILFITKGWYITNLNYWCFVLYSVKGLHVNFLFVDPASLGFISRMLVGYYFPTVVFNEADLWKVASFTNKIKILWEEFGYVHQQSTKPDTLGKFMCFFFQTGRTSVHQVNDRWRGCMLSICQFLNSYFDFLPDKVNSLLLFPDYSHRSSKAVFILRTWLNCTEILKVHTKHRTFFSFIFFLVPVYKKIFSLKEWDWVTVLRVLRRGFSRSFLRGQNTPMCTSVMEDWCLRSFF